MRYHRFEFENKPPIFRPPKYTGITLSLLSIFVLVSMLAVWEKMARIPELPVLNILAWEKSKKPLEAVKTAYQKEKACIINIHYLTLTELLVAEDFFHLEKERKFDLVLVPQVENLKFFQQKKNHILQSHVAYFNDEGEVRIQDKANQNAVPLIASTDQSSMNHTEALTFLRFLKAPTKGQVEFALNGWGGVNEDHWDLSPQIKFYAVEKAEHIFAEKVQEFAKMEGIELEASFLNENNILARLQLLTKSDYKDYLPDLVCLPSARTQPNWLFSYYFDFSNSSKILDGEFVLYIRKNLLY